MGMRRRRNKTSRGTGAGVRRSTYEEYRGRQADRIRDREMGIENDAWWERDRGRNWEKADICSAPAVRLKELSPPAPRVQASTAAELLVREKWARGAKTEEVWVGSGARHWNMTEKIMLLIQKKKITFILTIKQKNKLLVQSKLDKHLFRSDTLL